MAKDKDTIYIDIDDEITGIIDKLKASDGKVVALVLPKRATVFQSIVNMKLLKRAADSSKKNLVLITSEAGLIPLAGAAGIHVAKTLTSKPEIPSAPGMADDIDDTIEEDAGPSEPAIDPSQPIGALAGGAAAADGVETLMLDDEDLPPEVEAAAAGPKKPETPTKPKNKKLKIPNFERFRLLLILGGIILILLISGVVFAATALPKAVINIKTDAASLDVNLNLNLSTSAKTLDPDTNTLPSKLAQQQKTYSQQVPTTGQKNNGSKATGSINMTAQECAPNIGTPATVPAGAGFSANSQTYITQQDTTFSSIKNAKGNCVTYSADAPTPIIAQSGGSSFNTSGVTFTYNQRPDVSASGSASGGTDNIVQTVNQNDINSAKNKIAANDSSIKDALSSQLKGDGYYPIAATYVAGTPNTTSSANVGDVASSVTVTETITYTMFGVHENDLNTLIDNNIKDQIDTSKQAILDRGLGQAVFNVDNISNSAAQLTMSAKAAVGPDLDTNSIKQQAAGKQAGDIKSQLKNNPDVTDVNVKLSPFWVSTAPNKTSRITVNIAKPSRSVKASSSNASGQ